MVKQTSHSLEDSQHILIEGESICVPIKHLAACFSLILPVAFKFFSASKAQKQLQKKLAILAKVCRELPHFFFSKEVIEPSFENSAIKSKALHSELIINAVISIY